MKLPHLPKVSFFYTPRVNLTPAVIRAQKSFYRGLYLLINETGTLNWEKKKKLKERYDSTSGSYDDRYEEIQEKKIRSVEEFLDEARRLLDVGCGTGSLLERVSDNKELSVGVDFSMGMLLRAKERLGKSNLILADADNLPFRDDTFDLVASLTLLQNLPEPQETLEEMVRVTESDGLVLITSLEKKHSLHEIEEWMTSAGLKILKSEDIPKSEDIFCLGRKVR